MSTILTRSLAACAAVVLAASSIGTIVAVPSQTSPAAISHSLTAELA